MGKVHGDDQASRHNTTRAGTRPGNRPAVPCGWHDCLGRSGSEEPHEVIVGHLGCKTSGAGSVVVLRVGISASGQEGTHNIAISVAHVEQRPPQRGVTKPVAGMQVRPRFDQYGGYVCVLVLGSEVQRGGTFPIDRIHLIAMILEVSSHVAGPAIDGGGEQWRPSCTVKLGSHACNLWFPPRSGV
jgi:hypothetical protein